MIKQKLPYLRKLSCILLLIFCLNVDAQDSINYKLRKQIVVGGNAVAYSASMVGLYSLWYKDYPLTPFHFFNDNKEWNQMDKVGHAYSCYYEGLVGISMMKWAGYNHKVSSIIGGSYGFLIQAGVEVFDGFSEAWGASTGDLLSNAVGSAMVIGQSLAWDEQRILIKYSYSPSEYAAIRPNVLGSNGIERIFKDYNGQTYWLSVNPRSFATGSSWPNWLNIAIGYGIDGFVGGHTNEYELADGSLYRGVPNSARIRQWYLSPDIDLSRIKTDNKALRIGLTLLNSLKFPLPTLEYNSQEKFKLHAVKF